MSNASPVPPSAGLKLVPMRPKLKSGLPTEGLAILVGQPKSGKTTFAASFPDSYVLELEPGGGDRVAGDGIYDFKEPLPG